MTDKFENPEFTYVRLGSTFTVLDQKERVTGFRLSWEAKNIGFGQFVFAADLDTGEFQVDDEHMGRDFVGKALLFFLSKCEMEE